jgi:transcriptional regulator with XRE-family HTH domain
MRKNQSKFENAVRVELAKRQMSIADLADALGVTPAYIHEILRGTRKAYQTKPKIYEYFGWTDEDCH